MIKVKNLQISKDITVKMDLSLTDFNKKPTFDRVQLLDFQENLSISRFMTSENEIKIKKYTQKLAPSAKHQKLMLIIVKPK